MYLCKVKSASGLERILFLGLRVFCKSDFRLKTNQGAARGNGAACKNLLIISSVIWNKFLAISLAWVPA